MKNILVFPCGSEIGLEIYRSLKNSIHFNLIGGSSVKDHGAFVFENYVENIPFHNHPNFVDEIKIIIKKYNIDAIYPAMDAVAKTLKAAEPDLGCIVVSSPSDVTDICASKSKTYTSLKGLVPVPTWTNNMAEIETYPTFIKPDEGYGSRNVYLAKTKICAENFISNFSYEMKFLFCEYLPGNEYTIDCFTDRYGKLLFADARQRARISNGISVNTYKSFDYLEEFQEYAAKINTALRPRGAWFFQMKIDKNGAPKLLEVAARLGGSSALFRSKGVNFAQLSLFDAFDINVSINLNEYFVELDRALSTRCKIKIEYLSVYVNYDNSILLKDKLNAQLMSYLISCRNEGKKIILITRHSHDINQSLRTYKIENFFDEVIHILDKTPKSKFIQPNSAIFIDDSFSERKEVKEKLNIPVFALDMVEFLF